MSVFPTLWPVFEDALFVGDTGIVRSSRSGLRLDASDASLALPCDAAAAPNSTYAMLDRALLHPAGLLGVVVSLWASIPLPNATLSDGAPFTLTLTGKSVVVLRARAPAFTGATSIALGGIRCVLGAASSDGLWALVTTPSPVEICGSNTTECGYVALELTNLESSSATHVGDGTEWTARRLQSFVGELPDYNVTVACPPVCPGALDIPGVGLFAAATPGVVELASMPTSAGEGLPQPLPVSQFSSSSAGFYYTRTCAQTGVYTDPTSGVCADPSDPASYLCAYGAGGACRPCPAGGLCPGGSRLWTRAGYWVASDAATDVAACAPPNPAARCIGWNVTTGATQCGRGYLQGSYLCGTCAKSFFEDSSGGCSACPVLSTAWARYAGLVYVAVAILSVVLCVWAVLVLLAWLTGGTVAGGARRMVSLGVWSLLAAQAVSNAGSVASSSLPPIITRLYAAVAVLQFEGVLEPPACTGAYPFENEAVVLSLAMGAWGVAVLAYCLTASTV